MAPCCCCNDLYVQRGVSTGVVLVQRVRVSGNSAKVVDSYQNAGGGDYTFIPYGMDFLNKRLYGRGNIINPTTTNQGVFSLSEHLAELEIIVTDTGIGGEQTHGVWPYPSTEKIYYARGDLVAGAPIDATLRRINYDGTGDTALITEVFPTNKRSIERPCLPKDGSSIFYYREDDVGNFGEVRRCNIDGTGDGAIYTAANAYNDGSIKHVNIDNTHQKVMWTELNLPSNVIEFHRCNFDGSGEETYYTMTPGVFGIADHGPFWSHRREKVYWYITTSGANRGFWSCEYDGGNDLKIIDDDAWNAGTGSPTPAVVIPGCGFERTGPGYEV
jgi:hypothetical protein